MKIRHGFVSNSSSTAFVILVPKDFALTKEEISEFKDSYNECCDNEDEIELSDADAIRIFNEIISCDNYNDRYGGNVSSYVIKGIFHKRGLVINSIQTGPDDGSEIMFVHQDKIEAIIANGKKWSASFKSNDRPMEEWEKV